MHIIRCVLSGSFHKDLASLDRDYRELVMSGCQVLSPHKLEFDDRYSEFLKDKDESELSASEIERHHLIAIKQSSFVWLHCPDGYLGLSSAFELGYAYAINKPIFCKVTPADKVFIPIVNIVDSVFTAIESIEN